MFSGWQRPPVGYSLGILIAVAVLAAIFVPAASSVKHKPAEPLFPMSTLEIRAATETIAQSREFTGAREISLQRFAAVPADGWEEQFYRKLESLGLIQIENGGDIWKHRRAPNHLLIVTLTDAGTKASEHWKKGQHGDWSIPIAQPHIMHAYPTGEIRWPLQYIVFAVEYKWQWNELGAQLVNILPQQWNNPEGAFAAKALLLRPDNVWRVINIEPGPRPKSAAASSPADTLDESPSSSSSH